MRGNKGRCRIRHFVTVFVVEVQVSTQIAKYTTDAITDAVSMAQLHQGVIQLT